MTKPVITTRASKGSALTWTEGDTNLTNLQNATIAIKADTGGTDVVSDLNGTVTLVAGTNVTITGDNTAKTVTIAAAGGGGGLANIVEDLTPQLGGNLDVNGKAIVTVSNGSINLEPNGTGNINLSPATGKVIMSGAEWPTSTGSAGQVLTTAGGTGVLSWETPAAGGDVVTDLTPQLGGDLDVNGKSIISVSNGNIALVPNGTGNIQLTPSSGKIVLGALDFPTGMGTNGQVLTTNGSSAMTWSTPAGGAATLDELTDVTLGTPATGEVLQYNGTVWTDVAPSTLTVGAATVGSTVTLTADDTTNATNYLLFSNTATGNTSPRTDTGLQYNPSTGQLGATAISGNHIGSIGSITQSSGRFTSLQMLSLIETGGTASTASGAYTFAPNAATGTVQTLNMSTATALTFNGFTSPVAGQSITIIVTNNTVTTITSTMKWAGGIKTLTGTSGAIDIITVYYTGSVYYASISKGFA